MKAFEEPPDTREDLWQRYHLRVPSKAPPFHLEETRLDHRKKFYFCDWNVVLFGIDEDEIPSSEDEEGRFDLELTQLEDEAAALTHEEIENLRVGAWKSLTDDEVREAWIVSQCPAYGRRARQKPILHRKDHTPFECICDIDIRYCRYHVPHFGGGVGEGEELKVPHFKAFWEDLNEKKDLGGLDRVSTIFSEKSKLEKTRKRPILKFPEPNKYKIQSFKERLLASLRPLHCREVRRYRMPYAEALYLELQEDDVTEGAAFFKHLLEKDYLERRAPEDPAPLRNTRIVLDKIVEVLKVSEKFSRRKEYVKETYVYLKTGKYFMDQGKSWWWLAEEFFLKAVSLSQKCVIDGGKVEAITNYVFGTFLLDCVHRVQAAQEHLLKARELSQGKDWSARSILKKPQGTVHKESANYLCTALVATSRELREGGYPEKALPLIHRAYKICEELGSSKSIIEMETYYELGKTYLAVGMTDWAKIALRKFIEIAEIQDYVKGICHGYLEIAIGCRRDGDLEKCHRSLVSFNTAAQKRKNENLMAFGRRYLGEFHLNNGNTKQALLFFKMAFHSFLQQYLTCSEIPFTEWEPEHFTLSNDVELTRVLLGLAGGELATKEVCSLILMAEDDNPGALQQLIKWKDDTNNFWQEKTAEAPRTKSKTSMEEKEKTLRFVLEEEA